MKQIDMKQIEMQEGLRTSRVECGRIWSDADGAVHEVQADVGGRPSGGACTAAPARRGGPVRRACLIWRRRSRWARQPDTASPSNAGARHRCIGSRSNGERRQCSSTCKTEWRKAAATTSTKWRKAVAIAGTRKEGSASQASEAKRRRTTMSLISPVRRH
jgi:hypothetical protein